MLIDQALGVFSVGRTVGQLVDSFPRDVVVFGSPAVSRALVLVAFGALVVGILAPLRAQAASQAPDSPKSIVDAASAPTESAALSTAAAFKHPVVVEADTTSTTEVSALPDGTMQMVQSTVPVRVKSGSTWVALDETLAVGSSGFLAPKAADVPVEFGAGGSNVLARVQTKSGKWLDESSPFGVLPAPEVDGATATYREVLPGVDLQLTASPQGMSEVLVIKSAAAAANPKLHGVNFHVSGSALSSKAGGLTTATLPDGSTVVSTTPMWWDSSNGSNAEGPGGNASARPVSQTADASSISLDAQGAATTAGVQYPVYVDPDWTGDLLSYTYVDAAYPTQSYWQGQYATGQQRTGFVAASYSPDNVNHTARSLWEVDTGGVQGKHILASTFTVTEDWSFNCTASEVDLYWSAAISPSTTWNNQPGLLQLLSSATVAYGNNSSCPTHDVGFSATAGVQAAANANATSLTLELKAANEASNVSWKRFTQAATITINYNTPPTAPTALSIGSPSRSCGTSSVPSGVIGGPIVLQATLADPDAGTNVGGIFYLVDGTTSTTTTYSVSSAAQGVRTASVPSTALVNGHSYSWYVISNDGYDSSPASQTCYFVVDNTIPAAPTISAGAASLVGQAMNVVFGSDPAQHVTFAFWWTNTGLTSPAPNSPIPGSTNVSQALCNTGIGTVRFVCPNSTTGNSPSTVVAPIDATSTLWVIAYGPSGNRSSTVGIEVDSASDATNVDFGMGHGWITDGLSSPLPSVISDSNTTAGTGTTSEHDVSLNGGTANATGTANVVTGPVFSFPGATGTVAGVGTSGAALDITHSFTASAWIYASGTSASEQVALSDRATTGSRGGNTGFVLDRSNVNTLQFCLKSSSGTEPCANWSGLIPNTWTFVTGIYDASNKQLRLIIGDTTSPVVVTPDALTTQPITGPFLIGSSYVGSSVTYQWNGLIADPTVFPGVASASQIDNLFYQSPPQ